MDDEELVSVRVQRLEIKVVKTLCLASGEWILTCTMRIG